MLYLFVFSVSRCNCCRSHPNCGSLRGSRLFPAVYVLPYHHSHKNCMCKTAKKNPIFKNKIYESYMMNIVIETCKQIVFDNIEYCFPYIYIFRATSLTAPLQFTMFQALSRILLGLSSLLCIFLSASFSGWFVGFLHMNI